MTSARAKKKYWSSPPMHDDSPMPFGKHKNLPMRAVPPGYLDYLNKQDWIFEWPELLEYLRRREAAKDAAALNQKSAIANRK